MPLGGPRVVHNQPRDGLSVERGTAAAGLLEDPPGAVQQLASSAQLRPSRLGWSSDSLLALARPEAVEVLRTAQASCWTGGGRRYFHCSGPDDA